MSRAHGESNVQATVWRDGGTDSGATYPTVIESMSVAGDVGTAPQPRRTKRAKEIAEAKSEIRNQKSVARAGRRDGRAGGWTEKGGVSEPNPGLDSPHMYTRLG